MIGHVPVYTPAMSHPCIFCDKNSGSREHLWPKWIHERRDFGPLKMQRGKSEEIIIPDPELTVKTVCGFCNNGWMGKLEEENIPIIGSMFQGLTLPLDRGQQEKVAKWAMKSSMVLDSMRPRVNNSRFYTREECVTMREGLGIPTRTRIWIGRMDSMHLHAGGTDFISKTVDGDNPIVHASNATFVAGHFVVQVATQHTMQGFDDAINPDLAPKPGDWDRKLIQIWPVEREWVEWPPQAAFTNGGLEGIRVFTGSLADRREGRSSQSK